MHKHIRSILLAGVAAVATWPAAAAEVTPDAPMMRSAFRRSRASTRTT
jgi:hypothetical protein